MKTQAITGMSYAYKNNSNSNPNFGNGCTYVAIPVTQQEDSFVKWAGKSIVTASAVSLLWDIGTNVIAKTNLVQNLDKVSAKQMLYNVPKVAAIFLLVGSVFKIVNNIMDKN